MEGIKHAFASVKEKATGHHGHKHKQEVPEKTPGTEKAAHESGAPVAAAQSDPPTHGHAHSHRDPPGAPGIIETPAPGVVATGTTMPGLGPPTLPRI